MSQSAGFGGPTPRRSGRLSSKAGSMIEQSVVTTMTSGGTRQRRQGPLTKVKARRSNAYGASGRVGAAEELSITATGFAQAFQNQRGDAVARDDDEEETDQDESVDELNGESTMSGALNGKNTRKSPIHERSSPPPRVPVPFTFSETPEVPLSDDDLAFSIGNTSKSFGMEHEAGMLQEPQRRNFLRSSSQQPTPVPRSTLRLVGQPTRVLPRVKPTPDKAAIDESIEDLLAEERARLQREGPPPPRPRPTPHTIPRLATLSEPRVERQPEPQAEPHPQQQVQARPQPSRLQAVKQWLGQVEPSSEVPQSEILEDEPEWPYLSLLQNAFWGVMAVAGILLLSVLFSSAFSDPTRSVGVHTALANRISTAWYDLADWIQPGQRKYNESNILLTWLNGNGMDDDHLVWSRMWRNHQEYAAKFDSVDSAIESIKNDLPELVVVRRHPQGRLEITDDFWNALLSKAQSKDGDATWIDFLKANSKKVQALDSKPVDSGATARPQIVGREEFMKTVREHYENISTDVDRKIVEAFKTHETKVKTMIQAEARKTLMDSIRLQSLAQSNLVASYELNLKKPNYFSTGLGALVEPGRTSSTYDNSSTSLASLLMGRRTRRANPPKAALTKWEDFGDCWCAAPNPMRGYARLAVSLPRYVYPKQVTVEHAPMSMSPNGNIGNAPRNMELWAETDQPIKQHYDQGHNECLDPGDLKGHGYVCLGKLKYNVHAANHVQTFDLEAELSAPTTRVVMQVTSNWGAPNTCIYRVRLHGDDAEEKYNYDVTLND
ncbi:uncharacterized protein M421DRAFT_101475 [Didymella exigua CBS 183.55]|uniref:SUN domain-containing protein n=1 Tax=Didymella exigua CBS 183.55 TaxID=1150837 RepID=A0A6A5RIF2_9PLEO|nr:uncharacterized protein M421DRAFT_101475 [Didymella exigua CBS 183.55]KAF1928121.1 hypothetical protein M421DRAFT_101475 [Didymella exigua CBS 183.55]